MSNTIKSKKSNPIFSRGRTDITLLFIVLFLMLFGIVMIYSSSYYISFEKYGRHDQFLIRQVIWVLIGTISMYSVSRINYKFVMKFTGVLYVVVVMLLVAVLLQQKEINGSKRWLDLGGGIGFQPSELAKISIILSLGILINGFKEHIEKIKVFAMIMLVSIIPIGLIVVEDLSTAIIIVAIVAGMVFVTFKNIPKLILMVTPFLVMGGTLLYKSGGYRSDRIEIWLNGPFSDPTDKGFQTIQSLYAIGSGGFFGVGLGKSIQKIDVLPEAHNDIIFSIICEELGLFGAFSVLLLFFLLLVRLLNIIGNCDNLLAQLIVVGVMVHIMSQVFVNVAVVTNTIPATGIPLPFISYGGSSLLFLLFEIGIVLNIARQNNKRLEEM